MPFAALDIASGTVLTECKPRHRHQEFLGFLKRIDEAVPAALEVHLILDNYATHKHAKVRTWLAARPRFHLHFTPTYSSWLNQVERWFGLITQQALRRGSFKSVKELIAKINHFVQRYNRNSRPFAWTATADSILQKLSRLCTSISGTAH
jgi:putative transposase